MIDYIDIIELKLFLDFSPLNVIYNNLEQVPNKKTILPPKKNGKIFQEDHQKFAGFRCIPSPSPHPTVPVDDEHRTPLFGKNTQEGI